MNPDLRLPSKASVHLFVPALAYGVGGDAPVCCPLAPAPAPAAPGAAAVPSGKAIPQQLRTNRGKESPPPASSSSLLFGLDWLGFVEIGDLN